LKIQELYDVVEQIYLDRRSRFNVSDFEDLSRRMQRKIVRRKEESAFDASGDPIVEELRRTWNEIVKLKADLTDVGASESDLPA
jgi:hypothetical protein